MFNFSAYIFPRNIVSILFRNKHSLDIYLPSYVLELQRVWTQIFKEVNNIENKAFKKQLQSCFFNFLNVATILRWHIFYWNWLWLVLKFVIFSLLVNWVFIIVLSKGFCIRLDDSNRTERFNSLVLFNINFAVFKWEQPCSDYFFAICTWKQYIECLNKLLLDSGWF